MTTTTNTTYTLTFSTFSTTLSKKIISVTFAPVHMDKVEITSDADHEIKVGVGDARGETCWMLPPRQVGMIVRYTDDARKIWHLMIAEGWKVRP